VRIRAGLALATAAAAVAMAAACTGQSVTIESSGVQGRAVIRLAAGPDRPTGDLSFGEARQSGGVGSTCWRHPDGASACIDVAAVPIPEEPVEVPRAVMLVVDGDMSSASVSIGALTMEGSTRGMAAATSLDLSGGGAPLDVPAGSYVLKVDASWPQGEAPLYFLIDVV
jgi:hypothetical protein